MAIPARNADAKEILSTSRTFSLLRKQVWAAFCKLEIRLL